VSGARRLIVRAYCDGPEHWAPRDVDGTAPTGSACTNLSVSGNKVDQFSAEHIGKKEEVLLPNLPLVFQSLKPYNS